jgi:4-amino-4-deoxy-L-arabinose transferase-like glycosyltransferase
MLQLLTQRRVLPVTVAVAVGAVWRLWLMNNYAGWEESDYGNLAMIQGVLDSNFLHYDMNHMPGYYAAAALVHAVVGDSLVAGRTVSFAGGMIALGLAASLAVRLGGIRAGWIAGCLLAVQPEFALYASSSLREPLAAAWILGVLTALSRERLVLAGICAAGAFFVRFDLALVMAPLLVLHALGVSDARRRLLSGLAPLVAAVALWSVYCRLDHGTFAFWSHSVAVNIETGLGAEAEGAVSWWKNGAAISVGLLGKVLPWRIGWILWLGVIWACVLGVRQAHGLWRTTSFCGMLLMGLWAGVGFVGQHEIGHNLYWKWLTPLIPVLLPLGAVGAWNLSDRVARKGGAWIGTVLVVLGLSQAVFSNLNETHRQRERSEAWYRPQLNLALWIEANISPGTPMVVDNIPACWIRRRAHEHNMTSWFDVPASGGSEDRFADWLRTEQIHWVMWFREEWTQAPKVAPFLEKGGRWERGDVVLIERDREDGYGWIWFEVVSETAAQ